MVRTHSQVYRKEGVGIMEEATLEELAKSLYYKESAGGYILWSDLPEIVMMDYYRRAGEVLEAQALMGVL